MPINVEKPYAEVSVPFSALIFQQIASDIVRCCFVAGKRSNRAGLKTIAMFGICRLFCPISTVFPHRWGKNNGMTDQANGHDSKERIYAICPNSRNPVISLI